MIGAGRRLLVLAGGLLPFAATAAPPPPAEPALVPVSLNCDAISFRGPLDAAIAREIEPIHDLKGVAAVFTKHGIPFDRSRSVVTAPLPPRILSQIDQVPPGEPIVLPAKDGGIVCVLMPSPDSI